MINSAKRAFECPLLFANYHLYKLVYNLIKKFIL